MTGTIDQLLNFLAPRALLIALGSPLRILSAPTFLPLLGQPDLRRKRLLMNPHEDSVKVISRRVQSKWRLLMMFYLSDAVRNQPAYLM